jgi:hypothetical protein
MSLAGADLTNGRGSGRSRAGVGTAANDNAAAHKRVRAIKLLANG